MGCLFPFAGFYTGSLTENGKEDILLMPHGYGDFVSVDYASSKKHICPGAPIVYKNGRAYLTDPIPIPCGNCVGCRLEKAREWKERMVLESKDYTYGHVLFVTCTYDDDHLPINDVGEPVLSKHDAQQFIKNLRNHGVGCRYYCTLEYGSLRKRPHAHYILWLDEPLHLVPIGVNKFDCENLNLAWAGKGLIDVSIAEPGSMAYVAGYVEKKQADPDWYSYPVKPFSLKSDRPGIGFKALASIDLTKDVHVYGRFSDNRFSSFIPSALLRKLEDAPGFKEYKEHLKQAGHLSNLVRQNVYNTSSNERLGALRERDLYSIFQKNRSEDL